MHYNNRNFNNSRYPNSAGPAVGGQKNNAGNNIAEEWENENDEEWQGDLTKTQIFTSSAVAQKKPTDVVEQQQQPSANFPIGHFNAEEATQNIKRAVGVSSFKKLIFTIIK